MEYQLPAELLARAFRAPNGELAWARADAVEAAKALAALDMAILGGEVWLIQPDGGISGVIPSASEGGSVHHWDFAPGFKGHTRTVVLPRSRARIGPRIAAMLSNSTPRPEDLIEWRSESDSQLASETWHEFCSRAADYTISILQGKGMDDMEAKVDPKLKPGIRYNLTFVTRDRYAALGLMKPHDD